MAFDGQSFAQILKALARAVPDPNVAYRKSQRSQAASEQIPHGRARHEPNPPSVVPSLTAASASPAAKRTRRQSPVIDTEVGPKDNADGDNARHLTLEATTSVTAPMGSQVDMEAEIRSAKQLVLDLKRELQLRAAAGNELEDTGYEIVDGSRGVKRNQGEGEGSQIPGGVNGKQDRVVRSNKRVVGGSRAATTKLVWGAGLFGLGMAVAS